MGDTAQGREHRIGQLTRRLSVERRRREAAEAAARWWRRRYTRLVSANLETGARSPPDPRSRHERVNEEQAGRDEARLRRVVATMPVMIEALDRNGNIVAWNPECERVTGYSSAEVIDNPNAWELLYPDAGDRAAQRGELDRRGSDDRDWETNIVAKDGTIRAIAWSIQSGECPIPGWAALAVGIDVTDRKATEEALRQSEERFRAVFEQAGIGMVVLDGDGGIRRTNTAFRDMLGFSHEELEWLGLAGVAHPEDGSQVVARLLDGQADHVRTECRYVRRDGAVIRVDLTVSCVRDAKSGEPLFFCGMAVDITATCRTADNLRRSEARNRAMLDAVPDLLMTFDRDGTIADIHSPLHEDLVAPAGQLVGRSVNDVYSRRLATRTRHAIAQALHTGLPQKLQYALTIGGDARHFDAWFAPAEADQVLACVRNITDRVNMERRMMRAKKRAEEASAAKTRFLAAASHDLRQPLQALTMFVGVLANQDLGPKAADVVERIEMSLDSLRGLLNGLLDLSKLEAGLVIARKTDFAIADLLDRVANESRPVATDKGLRFTVVPCSLTVHSDPGLLERILRNFLTNAIRYTDHGRVLLGCRAGRGMLRVQVWDTGIGIAPDKLQAVFREFYQVAGAGGATSRDRGKGLGLGLAIVERLGRMLGHLTEVRSVVGKGSVFEVAVPLVLGNTTMLPMVAARHGGRCLANACVMAIDDDPMVREGLRLLLGSWGCRVITAASAAEAVARIGTGAMRPDLVIADYRLGDNHTGSEAVRLIHRASGWAAPGILITGDTGPKRLRDALRSGLRLLHKPVNPEELRDVATELLRQTSSAARNAG